VPIVPAARRYRQPPIEEALVEFRYVPARAWDPTIPGELFQIPELRAAYPGLPRTQNVLVPVESPIEGQPAAALQESQRVQFVDHASRLVLSVGPETLTVHVLRPYDGWEQFRPRIVNALTWCQPVLGFSHVSRVGLRYINRALFGSPQASPDTYFAVGPKLLPGLGDTAATFLTRVEYVSAPGDKARITHAPVPSQAPGQAAYLLDIDLTRELSPSVELGELMPIVDAMHEREGALFEASITDKLREVLDAR
jgi:uncharacterized protein (TIGR04255 family)